jgi:hypothetical protein
MRTQLFAVLTALSACSCASFNGNGLPGLRGEKVSRALAVLPQDRGQAGILSFRIENGAHAGQHRCEALGRGLTSRTPMPGWIKSRIGQATVYYAPMDVANGATVPGIYDLRNITPQDTEIVLLDRSEHLAGAADILARIKSPDSRPKPYRSGAWMHWYSRLNSAVPIDMLWSEDYAPSGERRPYGRSGFAIHTDQWEDPQRRADPANAGRPELTDFRFRDTNGCLKVRPACLELLNEFVSEQAALGRRVQCEVRQK